MLSLADPLTIVRFEGGAYIRHPVVRQGTLRHRFNIPLEMIELVRADDTTVHTGQVSGTPYTHPQYDPNAFYLHDLGIVVLDGLVSDRLFSRAEKEILRERKPGEVGPVEGLIRRAVKIACETLRGRRANALFMVARKVPVE